MITTPDALSLIEAEIKELKETLQSLRMAINANQDRINKAEKEHHDLLVRVRHLNAAADHLRADTKDV